MPIWIAISLDKILCKHAIVIIQHFIIIIGQTQDHNIPNSKGINDDCSDLDPAMRITSDA